MRPEEAEDIAVAAVSWMAGEAEVVGAFLSASGLAAGELRRRMGDPMLLAAVLDHVMTRDDWVCAMAAAADIRPEGVAAARAALPGGTLPHWT